MSKGKENNLKPYEIIFFNSQLILCTHNHSCKAQQQPYLSEIGIRPFKSSLHSLRWFERVLNGGLQ